MADITNLAINTTVNVKINEVKNEILSFTNLATTTALNAKINEVKCKISNITNLATATAVTAVENIIPGHSQYITTPKFDKLTAENFTARLKQTKLATKGDIADFSNTDFTDKLKSLNRKVPLNKSKHVLVENESKKLQDKMGKLQTYDSSLFIGQSYFFNDGANILLYIKKTQWYWKNCIMEI